MTVTLRQTESLPGEYPAVTGVPDASLTMSWQRIEHYIAWRFSEREVTWHVQSDGCEWHAPLKPVVSLSGVDENGEAIVIEDGATGGYSLPEGIVTLTATVGAEAAPEAVLEAVRRPNAYLAVSDLMIYDAAAGQSATDDGEEPILKWNNVHPGKAMQNSGAADLLRAYRRP